MHGKGLRGNRLSPRQSARKSLVIMAFIGVCLTVSAHRTGHWGIGAAGRWLKRP